MNNEQKRLETLLLNCIESEMKEPTLDNASIIPELAHELIELWTISNMNGVKDPEFKIEREGGKAIRKPVL